MVTEKWLKRAEVRFVNIFAKLTRMCKVLKVFPSKCQNHMWVPAQADRAGCVRMMGSTSCVWNSRKTQNWLQTHWCDGESVEEVFMVWMRAWLYMDLFRNISLAKPPPWIASSTSLSCLQWNLECSSSHCWAGFNCKWGTTGVSWE